MSIWLTASTSPCIPPAAPAWPAESWPPEVFTGNLLSPARKQREVAAGNESSSSSWINAMAG